MSDVEDFALSLHVAPHRAWSTVYTIVADVDRVTWFSQSAEHRGSSLDLEFLDETKPHRRRTLPRQAVAEIRNYLRALSLPSLPRGDVGLGGKTATIAAREKLVQVRWTWWGRLPDEWTALDAIANLLMDPTDATLQPFVG